VRQATDEARLELSHLRNTGGGNTGGGNAGGGNTSGSNTGGGNITDLTAPMPRLPPREELSPANPPQRHFSRNAPETHNNRSKLSYESTLGLPTELPRSQLGRPTHIPTAKLSYESTLGLPTELPRSQLGRPTRDNPIQSNYPQEAHTTLTPTTRLSYESAL